jgi:hypothetical protein
VDLQKRPVIIASHLLQIGLQMAKTNYTFEKRQKEIAKKQKKEEKRQRKIAPQDERPENDQPLPPVDKTSDI